MAVHFCKQCNADVPYYVKARPDTPHAGGAMHCAVCDRFLGWKKKEDNSQRRPKNRYLPEDLNIDFCQLCRRPKDRLGTNETLTSHHVIEIQEHGPDVPENIWVLCTSCHTLVHHQRTYLRDHTRELWENFNKIKQRLWVADPEQYDQAMKELTKISGM